MLPKTQSLIEALLDDSEVSLGQLLRMAEAAKWEMVESGHWHEPVSTAEGA